MRHATQIVLSTVFLALSAGVINPSPASAFWSDVSLSSIEPAGERYIIPEQCRTVAVDREALSAFLSAVPLEGSPAAAVRPEIELPLPDGGARRFAIVEAPIMAPELQARYPMIRTYAGYGIDDPTATVRLDLTQRGFHAQVLSTHGSFYIDPLQRGDEVHYQSYYRRDCGSDETFTCDVIGDDGTAEEIRRLIESGEGVTASGTQLRTYRAAVAGNGEYTNFHGGTVPDGLAAIITTMNRVIGVYEREVSIRFELVPDNDLLVFTDPATDPYDNSSTSAMLGQNQSTCDAVIGSANYDIGHVFGTSGGGVAVLSCVCRGGYKARGVTTRPAPTGDPFDVKIVCHEMGHQFSAGHTFNGTAGSCGAAGQYMAASAYEPGSGSTIMSYSGLCFFQSIQGYSDDYFVWKSAEQIVTYSTSGLGSTCPVVTPTGVIEPVPDAGAGGFTIPLGTPFELTGSAVTTGSPTYSWEESDLGPAGAPRLPSGNAPIFRSFLAVETPTRVFPKISDIVNGVETIGEIMPSYARDLSFRFTVRDFQAGGVGVARDAIAFDVAAVGPFVVTNPTTAVSWAGNSNETVTWDVAGTSAAPVSCASVNILLSTDGGYTYPIVLATGTPNDGSQVILVPNTPTTQARVKVAAAANVFFDISDVDFEITVPTSVPATAASPSGLAMSVAQPNPFRTETAFRFTLPQAGEATLRVYDAQGRLVRTLLEGTRSAGGHEVFWDGTDDAGHAVGPGIYLYRLDAMSETLTGRVTFLR